MNEVQFPVNCSHYNYCPSEKYTLALARVPLMTYPDNVTKDMFISLALDTTGEDNNFNRIMERYRDTNTLLENLVRPSDQAMLPGDYILFISESRLLIYQMMLCDTTYTSERASL